jgi:hypothetical protein
MRAFSFGHLLRDFCVTSDDLVSNQIIFVIDLFRADLPREHFLPDAAILRSQS